MTGQASLPGLLLFGASFRKTDLMLRLLIVIPVYLLMVGWLASWPPIQPFFSEIARIPQQRGLILSVVLLAIAAGWLMLVSRGQITATAPVRVVNQGAVGLAFGGIYNLFEGLTGRAITLNFMLIIAAAFLVSEIVYLIAERILNRQQPSPSLAGAAIRTEDQDTAPAGTNGLRLAVTIPVYVFVLVFLPRNDDYRRLVEPFNSVEPTTVVAISGAALILAGAIVLALGTGRLVFAGLQNQIIFAAAVGLGFGAAINIFGYFTGLGVSISDLILIPVGFTVAEAVFLALQWRLRHGPPEP